MKSGEWLPGDNRRPVDRTGWHALFAIALLLLISTMGVSCGDEDFTVGGPLPSRPTVDATNIGTRTRTPIDDG